MAYLLRVVFRLGGNAQKGQHLGFPWHHLSCSKLPGGTILALWEPVLHSQAKETNAAPCPGVSARMWLPPEPAYVCPDFKHTYPQEQPQLSGITLINKDLRAVLPAPPYTTVP